MIGIVFIQQALAIFNINIPIHSDQLMGVINTVLTIGAMLGLVYDFNSDNKKGDDTNGDETSTQK